MKTIAARLIAGVLVLLLLLPPAGLSAKEKRGYDLVVTRLDGSHVSGELIAVRPGSLLLLAGGRDNSVGRADIRSVRIVRQSKAGRYAGILALAGVAFTSLMAFGMEDLTGRERADAFLTGTLVLGGLGAAAGGLLGSAMGKDTTFNIAGEPEDLIAHYWDELPRYSREGRRPGLVVTPETEAKPDQAAPPAVIKPVVPPAAAPVPRRKPRISISLGETFGRRSAPPISVGAGSFRFSGDVPPGEAGPHSFDISQGYSMGHPIGAMVGPLSLSCEWKKHLSAELELFYSGRWRNYIQGVMTFTSSADGRYYMSDFYRTLDASFSGFLVGLTWRPLPPTPFRRHIIEAGAAVGPAFAKVTQRADIAQNLASSSLRKVTLSGRVHAAYDFYFVPYLSIGAFAGYRYLQANRPGSAFSADFWFVEVGDWTNHFARATEVTFPDFPVRATVTFWGLRATFRF